jgi:micrococcal nuclease
MSTVTWTYHALVHKIVDGDTIDLIVDLGFKTAMQVRFRLLGVDCPDRGETDHRKAANHLADLTPLGSHVIVESHKTEKYGRWLGVLYVDDKNINTLMRELGWVGGP